MGRDLKQSEAETLEALIDNAGLCAVLQTLSTICGEKAEHVAENHGDALTATAWLRAEGVLGVASVQQDIIRIGEP